MKNWKIERKKKKQQYNNKNSSNNNNSNNIKITLTLTFSINIPMNININKLIRTHLCFLNYQMCVNVAQCILQCGTDCEFVLTCDRCVTEGRCETERRTITSVYMLSSCLFTTVCGGVSVGVWPVRVVGVAHRSLSKQNSSQFSKSIPKGRISFCLKIKMACRRRDSLRKAISSWR